MARKMHVTVRIDSYTRACEDDRMNCLLISLLSVHYIIYIGTRKQGYNTIMMRVDFARKPF